MCVNCAVLIAQQGLRVVTAAVPGLADIRLAAAVRSSPCCQAQMNRHECLFLGYLRLLLV
jgi:hypothetical protein